MKLFIQGTLKLNKKVVMNRLGYHEYATREGKVSYSRRLASYDYPRFHVYLNERAGGIELNIHLDEKQPSYSGTHAHAGQYEGSLVEEEAARILHYIESL